MCVCGSDGHSFSGSNSGTKVIQGEGMCLLLGGVCVWWEWANEITLPKAFGQVSLFMAVQFCVPDVMLVLPF